jgi:hypothetical protein
VKTTPALENINNTNNKMDSAVMAPPAKVQKSPDSMIRFINALIDSTLDNYRGNWKPSTCGFPSTHGYLSYKEIRSKTILFKIKESDYSGYVYKKLFFDSMLIERWEFPKDEINFKAIEVSSRFFNFPNGTFCDSAYFFKIINLSFISNNLTDTIKCQFAGTVLETMKVSSEYFYNRCYIRDLNIDRAIYRFDSIYTTQKSGRFIKPIGSRYRF